MHGACLLGEMPHIFTQLPYPEGVAGDPRGVLDDRRHRTRFQGVARAGARTDQQLGELLAQVEKQYGQQLSRRRGGRRGRRLPRGARRGGREEAQAAEDKRIEELFDVAKRDRSKAFELKRELDRLELFKEYEDRFLDLFKKAG